MMTEGIHIERLRAYSPEDARRLGVLRQVMSPGRSEVPMPKEQFDQFIYFPTQRAMVLAREAQNGIVSSATINRVVSPDLGTEEEGQMGWLGFVATLPAFRRRGIFEMVWREGLSWCDENGIAVMDFTSNATKEHRVDAVRFYENHGAKRRDTTYFRVAVKEALSQLD